MRPSTSLLVLSALLAIAGIARADGGAPCRGADSAQVTAARAALAAAPESLPARFKLADSLVEANCFHDAVHTLEDGRAIHPRSTELQAKLRNTRSLVNEQDYFEGKEQAELAARQSRNLLRCTKLGDVAACDEALKLRPDDVEILLGKGDALLKASRPADAELVNRRARQLAPDDARIATQLAAARIQRQSLLGRCDKGTDDAALQACQHALLKGAEDEFSLHSRIALLSRQRGELAQALASYIAAHELRPGDRGVALGLVTLTEGNAGSDAVALAARGSALITLRRGSEALAALRQAQTLDPSMKDLKTRIAQAQELASAEPLRAAPATLPSPAVSVDASAPQVAQAHTYTNAAEPTRSH